MKKITTLSVALSIAIASAGTATAQVKFGVGGPITGPSAATGAQMKNGVDQAATDINAAGGILGQKISVSYGDDVSDPKQGVSVANKFAADGVKFVIGHYNSGVTIPSSEVYQENGVLQITPASTNPTVTERKMWNLVSRQFGSWLFLGAIFTTLELPPDDAGPDSCGSCRACLDVCPTAAFPAPYRLDARRCISYLTIEHKGPIPRELRPLMGNRIYGCDDCDPPAPAAPTSSHRSDHSCAYAASTPPSAAGWPPPPRVPHPR